MDKNYFVNGHVQLINDTTNEILVDADNLIVNDGRKAIIETLQRAGFFKIFNSEMYNPGFDKTALTYLQSLGTNESGAKNDYSFKEIVFGYGNDEVGLDNNYDKIKQLSLSSESGEDDTVIEHFWHIDMKDTAQVYSPETRSIEFTISFTGQTVFTSIASDAYSTAVISELGIVLNKVTESTTANSEIEYNNQESVLFSRIRFDPISIVSDNAYTLKYVLYF